MCPSRWRCPRVSRSIRAVFFGTACSRPPDNLVKCDEHAVRTSPTAVTTAVCGPRREADAPTGVARRLRHATRMLRANRIFSVAVVVLSLAGRLAAQEATVEPAVSPDGASVDAPAADDAGAAQAAAPLKSPSAANGQVFV